MIAAHDVHVWRIPLDSSPDDSLVAVLSPGERRRASRFYFERDRRRFLASHVALRHILSLYTLVEPSRLEFTEGEHGKPALAGCHFNLSHSGELALCAVACGREIGVDVEAVREMHDLMAVARRFFTPPEAEFVAGLPEGERPGAFFRIWTRTEAWLKATGQGISGLGTPCPETWTVTELDVGSGYAGAVAVEGPADIVVRNWKFGDRLRFH